MVTHINLLFNHCKDTGKTFAIGGRLDTPTLQVIAEITEASWKTYAEALAGDQAFTAPVLGGTFSGVFASPGDLYFDTAVHVLYGNTDADTAAEFAIQLVGVTTLTAADLFL